VDEFVQSGLGVGDAPWPGDQENLPVFELLDIIYGLLEAGAVVEENAGSVEVS
jgi:hypothetical protein